MLTIANLKLQICNFISCHPGCSIIDVAKNIYSLSKDQVIDLPTLLDKLIYDGQLIMICLKSVSDRDNKNLLFSKFTTFNIDNKTLTVKTPGGYEFKTIFEGDINIIKYNNK